MQSFTVYTYYDVHIKGVFVTTVCLSLFTVIWSDTDRRNWNPIVTYGISDIFRNAVCISSNSCYCSSRTDWADRKPTDSED